MKRKRFSVEQITAVLRQHEAGVPVADLARTLLGLSVSLVFCCEPKSRRRWQFWLG